MSEKDLRILQAIECSTMVSAWQEYLCLEMRDGRAVLSDRRYEVIGEVSDFAVETEAGDEEFRIPDFIGGKRVVGTEDEFIVGGELTLDPSDSEPELDLADADPDKVRAWLTERGFDPELGSEVALAKGALEGQVPSAQCGDEPEEPDGEEGLVEPISAADIGPVTQIRVRLKRWREIPATPENDYLAEVIKVGDAFHYRARGITVPITEDEAVLVIRNPFLYYFSTALRLHKRIDRTKEQIALPLRALIGECCPDWEVLDQRTPEETFRALQEEFGVSGYQTDGMDEPVEFEIESLEFAEEQAAIGPLDESVLADWLGELHEPAVELGPLVRQLQDLAARAGELQLIPTVITAGMKYCGTITSARIRVTMRGDNSAAALDIRPVDSYWETHFDRTFGSMWESPDDP